MPALQITEQELKVATLAIYGLNPEHAPNQVWIDHFDEDWSYLRATFQSEFCTKCGRRLLRLVAALRIMSGNEPDLTVVIYVGKAADDLPDQRQAFVRGRLAGFRP
jgi:hypothetical protein